VEANNQKHQKHQKHAVMVHGFNMSVITCARLARGRNTTRTKRDAVRMHPVAGAVTARIPAYSPSDGGLLGVIPHYIRGLLCDAT